MAISLVTEFQPHVDELFTTGSKKSLLTNNEFNWTGAHTVKRMAERSKRTGINQDRVVLELAKIAFVKMTDIVDDHGRIKGTATDDDLACIESIKYKESDNEFGGSVEREVKIGSKLKALELLGKHLGMWNDKVDLNITSPIVISGEDALED